MGCGLATAPSSVKGSHPPSPSLQQPVSENANMRLFQSGWQVQVGVWDPLSVSEPLGLRGVGGLLHLRPLRPSSGPLSPDPQEWRPGTGASLGRGPCLPVAAVGFWCYCRCVPHGQNAAPLDRRGHPGWPSPMRPGSQIWRCLSLDPLSHVETTGEGAEGGDSPFPEQRGYLQEVLGPCVPGIWAGRGAMDTPQVIREAEMAT